MFSTSRYVALVACAQAVLLQSSVAQDRVIQQDPRQRGNAERAFGQVIEITPYRFPTSDSVAKISRIAPTTDNQIDRKFLTTPDDVVAAIRDRCGWADPAILAEFAKINDLSSFQELSKLQFYKSIARPILF